MDDDRQVSFEELEHRAAEAVEKKQRFFVRLFSAALDILTGRLLLFLTMIFSAGLFAWVMLEPTVLRLLAASLFVCGVFLPTLFFHSENKNGPSAR